MSEAVVPSPAPAPERRASVVTNENRAEYMAERMRIPTFTATGGPTETKQAEKPAEKPEKSAETAAKPADEHQEPERKQNAIQERFSKMAQQRREAEAREQQAVAKAQQLQAELDALKAKPKAEEPEPDAKKYNDPYKYAKDLARWEANKIIRERDEAARAEAEKASREANERVWRAKEKTARGIYEDYDDVMAAAPKGMTRELASAIFESDLGAHVAYFLAQDEEQLEKLMKLSPTKMIREFDKLEDQIRAALDKAEPAKKASETESPAPPAKSEPSRPVRRVQEPPEPIKPLNGSGSGAPSSVIDDKGNVTGDYQAYRAARKAGRVR